MPSQNCLESSICFQPYQVSENIRPVCWSQDQDKPAANVDQTRKFHSDEAHIIHPMIIGYNEIGGRSFISILD